MFQVVQNVRSGRTSVARVPQPVVRDGYVLIRNVASVISAGTEKMVIDLSGKSLLSKARERPDHVRQVLNKVRTQGLLATFHQVNEKLNEPISLGYSSAGVVLACGAGVQAFKPGDCVASNGPHAGVVCVPKNLCARIPDEVPFEQAALAVMGSIALQGVRLAKLSLGDVVLVIGLGLVGQITVKLLKAQGCVVLGTDPDAAKCSLALEMGADAAGPKLGASEVRAASRSIGADAVLITAATKSDGPVQLAGEAVRAKGRVVAVGAVGLNLPRQPYYLKEAEFVVSCSYGPGRYDPDYEDRGHDYPAAYVRWTEQRNLQAVLDLMASGKLDLSPLISHRFGIEQAEGAYELIRTAREPYLGIVLEYGDATETATTPVLQYTASTRCEPVSGKIGVGCLGAGGFARAVLLPAVQKVSQFQPRILCSASGLSAVSSAQKLGFPAVTASEDEVLADANVQAVFILTRHNQHARQVVKCLQAGKHVFVEKPLALTTAELEAIESALLEARGPRPTITVGFNRRFSPAARAVKEFFAKVKQPLTVSIRFNAGMLSAEHWTQNDEVGGGRIIGEACHAIDLATYLVGSPPVRVFAESIGGPHAPTITDDQCFITLRHANGSISNVAYLAGGDKSYAKERIEVLGGERLAVIDDFREVTLSVGGNVDQRRMRQDKGHQAEVAEFARVLSEGGPPTIAWQDLRTVTLASILAVRSLREGVPLSLSAAPLAGPHFRVA